MVEFVLTDSEWYVVQHGGGISRVCVCVCVCVCVTFSFQAWDLVFLFRAIYIRSFEKQKFLYTSTLLTLDMENIFSELKLTLFDTKHQIIKKKKRFSLDYLHTGDFWNARTSFK